VGDFASTATALGPPLFGVVPGAQDQDRHYRHGYPIVTSSSAVTVADLMSTILDTDSLRWHDRAACAGTSVKLWFPRSHAIPPKAKAMCAGCPVRLDCLSSALERGDHWVRAGLQERPRRRLGGIVP